VQYRQL
jgi:hypothetical protein